MAIIRKYCKSHYAGILTCEHQNVNICILPYSIREELAEALALSFELSSSDVSLWQQFFQCVLKITH